MNVEFLVKLRDAASMIVDAANEQLEKIAPSSVKYDEKDFDNLKWETKEGTKADYQQTTKEANENSEVFQALKQILQDHKGFWQSSSHKYWFHQNNQDIIDRRKKEGVSG